MKIESSELGEQDSGERVFKRASLRNSFFGLVVDGFEHATSQDELATLYALKESMLDAMMAGSDFDQMVAQEIATRFFASQARIEEQTKSMESMANDLQMSMFRERGN